MRSATMAVVAALGLMTMTCAGSAGPAVPNLGIEQDAAIVQIAGGCGRDGTRTGGVGASRTITATTAPIGGPMGPTTVMDTSRGIGRHPEIMGRRTT